MSDASNQRSAGFLRISGQFKLGALVTEASHPATDNLSEVAKQDLVQALDLLFEVCSSGVSRSSGQAPSSPNSNQRSWG